MLLIIISTQTELNLHWDFMADTDAAGCGTNKTICACFTDTAAEVLPSKRTRSEISTNSDEDMTTEEEEEAAESCAPHRKRRKVIAVAVEDELRRETTIKFGSALMDMKCDHMQALNFTTIPSNNL